MSAKNILLTGKPKCGKTTMIIELSKHLHSVGGFFTQEFGQGTQRLGFKIVTLEGKQGLLAQKGLKSRFRLGKYGIRLEDLEEIGVVAIIEALNTKQVVVIDEIAKMELFSDKFKGAVLQALDSNKRVLGAIQQSDIEFLNQVRSREDTLILELRRDNRQEVLRRITDVLANPL